MSARGTWTRPSLEERAMSRFEVAENGCWIWQGEINSEGYGMILPNGQDQRVRAHRVVYEHLVGLIPEGLTLDHTCHTSDSECVGGKACQHRACVNPAHLEPVTLAENVRRGAARKTHCINGHAFTPENTRMRRGSRECVECKRKTAAQSYLRNRAKRIEAMRHYHLTREKAA